MFTWKTLSFLSLLGVGYALDTAVSVDFDTDVVFAPADAWHEEYNTACASDDHYTSVINATASLTFTGNRVQVSGLRNNNSGSFSITIDDMATHTYNLQSADVLCELFIDYFLDLGTHNLTLSLSDVNQPAYSIYDGEIWGTNLVLHLTDIVYFVPETNATASLSSTASTHKAAIVGGVIGGVALLFVVFAALVYALKKQPGQLRKSRHSFDPRHPKSTVFITELSPRSPRTGGFEDAMDSKLPSSYTRMEDDNGPADTKSPFADPAHNNDQATLAVPTLVYASAQGERVGKGGVGLRSRSKSPMPSRRESDV